MSDAESNPWSDWLKSVTSRPGWSIARLARESGLHRSTIFRWINGDRRNLTLESVKMIADGAQVDLLDALRAVAALMAPDREHVDRDEGERIILDSAATDAQKKMMLTRYRRRVEAARQQTLDDLREQIELLGHHDSR